MMAVMEQAFANRLQAAIEASGKTPYRVAKDAGVSTPHLYNLLGGKRQPTDEVASKLARALGLSEGEVLAWTYEERAGADRVRELQADLTFFRERLDGLRARRIAAQSEEKRLLLLAPNAPERGKLIDVQSELGRLGAEIRSELADLRERAEDLQRLLAEFEGE